MKRLSGLRAACRRLNPRALLRSLFEMTPVARPVRRMLRLQEETCVLALLGQERYRDPKRLNRFEAQCFSANGQDGILGEIFRRIGTTDRRFVEVGTGNGLENNTAYLLRTGWSGIWFDGDAEGLEQARQGYRAAVAAGRLKTRTLFATRENIAGFFHEEKVPATFDLLSLDIDRNTYQILEGLAEFKPRVIVVEYNPDILPSDAWIVDYDPAKTWNGTNYFGASLKAFELLGARLGYSLVGCTLAGTDAFFVRSDLVGDLFCQPYTSENHHEPGRYFIYRQYGHPAGYPD